MAKRLGYPFSYSSKKAPAERHELELPDGALGQRLLAEQMETQKTLGRLEAQMESQQEQTRQLNTSLENMGNRLEKKIDGLKESMDASNTERTSLCREHSERLKALEHDKMWLKGASRPIRWMLGILVAALAAIGMTGLNLLADWLKHIMGM